MVGGDFTSMGSEACNRIARLNPDGSLDTGFNPNADGLVYTLTVQPDGKILVGGGFTSMSGEARNRIARLHPNGSLDTGFNPNADGSVSNLVVQLDGKILVGGGFTSMGGEARNRIARLHPNGSLDTGFNPNPNYAVLAMAVQLDGKILVGGHFTSMGGEACNHIARLLPDGSLDTGFNPNVDGWVYTLAVQPDGKILVGGDFTSMGGVARNRIARLHPDGSLDTGFNPYPNWLVYTLAVQPDGKILVGGDFTSMGGVARNRIARLHPDGSLDTGFNPNANGDVLTLAIQADGKILVGGNFTGMGGEARNRIARLHPNGSLDIEFDPSANGSVLTLAIQADGKILVGGNFTSMGGKGRLYIARLHPDGSLDIEFDPSANGSVMTLAVQPDGKILGGGNFTSMGRVARNYIARLAQPEAAWYHFKIGATGKSVTWLRAGCGPEVDRVTFEQSMDGATWTALGNGTRIWGGWRLSGLTLPIGQFGYLRARGYCSDYISTSIHESIKQFYVSDITPVSRILGSNRYTTAVEVSQAGWADGAATVLLARGDDFPDSLAGVSLAHQLNAPILLTATNSLNTSTSEEIQRLGAKRVIILGGTGAISVGVETALLAISSVDTVDRLGGANRYETAKLIAEELGKVANFDTAFIAFGHGFPDALAASAYGAMNGYPILLTGKSSLPTATKAALDSLSSIGKVVIVGGEAVISDAVRVELQNRGMTVARVMGANRYQTALELAKTYLPVMTEEVFIATGLNFPDALAGGVLAAKRYSGVLLVPGNMSTLPGSVEALITGRVITRAIVLGGTSAVSEGVETRLLELLE